MNRIILAALALACVASPALADAGTAVTWGGLGFIALMVVLGVAAVAVILFVLGIIANGFNH
ncbi:hypothetical protein [Methylobacterium trifolii]|uniref:Uncharacterized protein n=1 Tax=Methylobacterium trifolii TaxID=1003092 RepID=A0ABQ4U2K2_9HYPH|nr:hypothetical protein [Methylobacterium trifolii]GJE61690.1 hypothetical protein MPOCJGCO_3813 [Methylobacterium trifolii]